MRELLENARCFRSPERPLVVHIRGDITSEHCVIRFEDNGIGIPENSFDKVLLPFAKVDFQSEREGMGLAYCQLIANRHGGYILLSDTASVGLAVSIFLPLGVIQETQPQ